MKAPTKDLGMDDVGRRNLGWRMWWSGPWLATRLVAATKPLHIRWLWLAVALASMTVFSPAAEPLRLHPDNPHYFLFRGKPTVLVTSGEHYGAVLNQDFDYLTYLDTLKAEGMNLTRVVPGTSLESTNATSYRGGDQNTFAPRPGRFLAPWARSDTPGYFYGGNKFDL